MSPSRLDVAFNSNLLDHLALPERLSAALARLRDLLPRQAATAEFALIALWALTPFAIALLIS